MNKSMTRVNRGVARAVAIAIACGSLSVASAAETEAVKADKAAVKDTAEREQKLEAARKRLDEAAREVAELSMTFVDDGLPGNVHFFGRNVSRAMLGVNIGMGRDDKRKDGVEILSVSPGGPAADAGLKTGDVLVEIKGKSLKQDESESPREKLLAAMREVDPEEKVQVRYVREGKTLTATVAARPVMEQRFTRMLAPGPGVRVGGMPFMLKRGEGVFGSAELATITPKLGQYFGTDKGLLVVRAPSDSRLKLEEGDVIVDIDGRVPSSPSHAWRILESYQSGEKLKLNVLRMKKRMTFDVTVPDDPWERRIERSRMEGPEDVLIPAPPDAPLPVMPGTPPGARNDTA